MKKSWLALVLVLALCLGLAPLAAFAADEPTGDEPAKVITSGLKRWWDLTTQGADHFVAADFAADCAYFLNDAPSPENDVKTAAAKRGTVVEVYTNAGGEISAVKTYEYTATIVYAAAIETGEVYLTCKLHQDDGGYRLIKEKAEKITGKVSAFSTGGELTINGVGYQPSEQKVEEDVSEFRVSEELFANWSLRGGSMTKEYNFYLDKNGSIIAITSLNPNMELNRVCMVVSSWLENGNRLGAELLFLDGTTESVAVTKLGDQSVVAQPTQAVDQIAPADALQALGAPHTKFFRYHATDDGYELTELNAAEASGNWEDPVSVGDGSATVATIVKESRFAKAPNSTSDLAGWDITVDDSTLFIMCRRFASNNVVYQVYRDFSFVPEMDVTRMTAICANTSDGPDTVARLVYLEKPEYQQTPGAVDPDSYTAGYIFITSNAWTLDPELYMDDVAQVKVVDVDGYWNTMRVAKDLRSAIAADSLAIQESRNYVGHFFSVGEISTKGVVSSLTNGATPPAAKAVALDDVVAMGGGIITLSDSTYQYDAQTAFVYVDMGWTDGDQADNKFNVLEPDQDSIDLKNAGNFNPEHFFDPNEVGPDQVYTSVRAAVIPSATDKALAGSVYVLRTLEIPADALSIPDVPPSATPSVEPSPSTKPSGGSSGGGGGGGFFGGGGSSGGSTQPSTPTESPKPTESEKPAQSEKPVETEMPATPASQVFQDVAQGAWYEAGVTYVVDKGLFQGVAQNVFAPNEVMTRAMLMTVLARLDGQDTSGGKTWFQKGMDWAVDKAISDGTQPNASVTREQMVTMLYRYAKPAAGLGELTAFADAESVSDWAQAAVEWAVSQGVLTGKDGSRLDPQGTATRAEVATILQRFVALKK